MVTYHAPYAWLQARPHRDLFMVDDPASPIAALRARYASELDPETAVAEAILEKSCKTRGTNLQKLAQTCGVLTLSWEIGGLVAFTEFASRQPTFHRFGPAHTSEDAINEGSHLPMDALVNGPDAVYMVFEGYKPVLPSGRRAEGVMATKIKRGDEDLLQVTLWPQPREGAWPQHGEPYGLTFNASFSNPDLTLIEAADLAISKERDTMRASMLGQHFPELLDGVNTARPDNLDDILAIVARALSVIATSDVPATWQAGIPQYKLDRLTGPKAAQTAAALRRNGFVEEHRYD